MEMIIDKKREKLLNAIIYFVDHTKYCQKTKLFKLLYLLDFEHFKETGKSVTGLDYYAWPMGPVPKELFIELNSPQDDLVEKIHLEKDELDNSLYISSVAEFNEKLFSKREMRLINKISIENELKYSKEMVRLTHDDNGPWDLTYNKMSAKNAKIEYDLILNDLNVEDANLIKSIASEIQEEADELKGAFN